MTVLTVETAAELMEAFETAPDGSVIELSAGSYGTVTLEGRIFDAGLTLRAADGGAAVLTDQFVIDGVTGLTVTGIDLEAGALATDSRSRRVEVSDSTDIHLADMEIIGHLPTAAEGRAPFAVGTTRFDAITGYGYEGGLRVENSTDVTVTDVTFADLRVAVGVADSRDVVLSGLDIGHVREGINFHDVSGMIVEDSHFHDFKPWRVDDRPSDHSDMIQYWGTNSESGVHNITIRDNLFHQAEGAVHTQTIYGSMKNAPAGVTASDFTISGNTIINGHLNAISLYDMQGATIEDNLLLPMVDLPDDPKQVTTPGIVLVRARDIDISGNTLLAFWDGDRPVKLDAESADSGTIRFADDNVLLSTDPDSPLFWRDFLPGAAASSGSGDTPSDDTPSGDASLAEAALAGGATLVEGTDGGDVLRGSGPASVLRGKDGSDKLWAGDAGEDNVHEGGAGADRFLFDLRNEGGQSRDVIADLDFGEGDKIMIYTDRAGQFTDDTDPANALWVSSDGSRTNIDSLADIAEAVASGALSATDGAHGLVLSVPDLEARMLEIAGVYTSDLPM